MQPYLVRVFLLLGGAGLTCGSERLIQRVEAALRSEVLIVLLARELEWTAEVSRQRRLTALRPDFR